MLAQRVSVRSLAGPKRESSYGTRRARFGASHFEAGSGTLALMRSTRGFTLIEIMFVVLILGILAAVAIAAFTKNIRNAHKSQVIADLAHITLRQQTHYGIGGHFASSTSTEDAANTYPAGSDVSDPDKLEIPWDINDAGYTGAGSRRCSSGPPRDPPTASRA